MSKVRKTRTAQIDLNSPEPTSKEEDLPKVGGFSISPEARKLPNTASKRSPKKKANRVSILTDISFAKPKPAK